MSGNMVGGFYTSAIGFEYNTDVLKKRKIPEPKCWADLVMPAYKGEIEKYGKAAERKRLIARWTREVEALPR